MSIIVLVGTSRSGKTALAGALSKSPSLFAFRELHFFGSCRLKDLVRPLSLEQAVEQYASHLDIQTNGILDRIGHVHFLNRARQQLKAKGTIEYTPLEIYKRFLADYADDTKPGARPCDQTGTYIYLLDEILTLLPDIRVICMVRDPRLAIASKKHKWSWASVRGQGWALREWLRQKLQYHPWILARMWATAAKQAIRFRGSSLVRIQSFEALVEDTEQQLSEICRFLNVEYKREMSEAIDRYGPGQSGRHSPEPGVDTVRSCETLDISPTELFLVQWVAAKEMKIFGYDPWPARPSLIKLVWYLLTLPVVLVSTVMANLSRTGDLADAIKRRIGSRGRPGPRSNK